MPRAPEFFVSRLLVTEFTGGSGNGYTIRDAIEFDSPFNVGAAQAPVIVSQPASLAVDPGATGTTLTLTNVQAADAGTYTVTVTNGLGAVTSDPAALTVRLARLTNVSVRSGAGDNVLIVGFATGGSSAKTLLIRGIGPTLAGFGVDAVLADPQLQLFNESGSVIGQNNDWGGAGNLATAFTTVAAFPLAANSHDAVLLVTLPPGSYTAQVSGIGNTTGVALVEVYEMP